MSTKTKKQDKVDKTVREYKRPLLAATLKTFSLILIIAIGLFYSDFKGYFEPNQTNNHTLKKWHWFYKFTKKNNVDVLLMGNSHLYSGINPKNLSAALGANAFIIASPGTSIVDTYFGLKDALTKCEPKLVVIETYGINNTNPYELEEGALSDQFKSFAARKNIVNKITSTPLLFRPKNYPYAWSNTIRNHDYFFTNKTQLENNLKLINGKEKKDKDKLYLGRYVRFTKGLNDSIINLYNTQGAPVNGSDYTYGSYAEHYVDKIVSLCKKKNIELLFLTVPMYSKHVKNYQAWKTELATLLGKYDNKWFDLQEDKFQNDYPPICFENTYSTNQHLTLQGSLISTYKLANYITTELALNLPDRSKDTQWHKLFYAEEGYFENYTVLANDKKNISLSKNMKIQNIELNEILLLNDSKNKRKRLLVKIDRDRFKNLDSKKSKLVLAVKIKENNVEKIVNVQLNYDGLHETKKHAIFLQLLKPLDIIEVVDGKMFF